MRPQRLIFYIMIGLAAAPAVMSCSGNNKASQIQVEVIPIRPPVITGDYTPPGSSQTITAPWFQFQIKITNNSDEYVTFVGIETEVTAYKKSDMTPVIKITAKTASSSNYMVTCPDGSTGGVSFTDYGEYAPSESRKFHLTNKAPLPASCTGVGGPVVDIDPAYIPIPSNPDPRKEDVDSYVYSVKLTPIGWFGRADTPTTRFTKSIYFSTQ